MKFFSAKEIDALKFSIPISIETAFYMLFIVIDQYFITFISESAVAGVGLNTQIFFTCEMIFGALGIGMASALTRSYGRSDLKNFTDTSLQFFFIGTVLSIMLLVIFFCCSEQIFSLMNAKDEVAAMAATFLRITAFSLPFMLLLEIINKVLRAMGNSVLPMITTTATLLINTTLNYIVVFGLKGIGPYGVEGVGAATILARLLGFVLSVIFLFSHAPFFKNYCTIKAITTARMLKKWLTFSVPVVSGEILRNIGLLLLMVIAAQDGKTSTLISYQIVFNLQTFFIVFSYGISVAALVFVGHEIGKKNYAGAGAISKTMIVLSLKISIVTAIITLCFSAAVKFIYVELDAMTVGLIAGGVLFSAVFEPVCAVNSVFRSGILRSGGDNIFLLATEVVSTAGALATAYYACFTLNYGLWGVLGGWSAGELIRLALYAGRFNLSENWIKTHLLQENS